MPVNYLDIIISIPLVYGLVKGFENGLIKEVTGVIAIISGLYIAIHFSSFFESKVNNFFEIQQQFIPIITFVLLFFMTVVIFKVLGSIIDRVLKFLALGFISKIFGSIFGVLKVFIILGLLLTMVNNYDLINKKTKQQSMLFEQLEWGSELIIPELNKYKANFLESTEKKTKEIKESIKKISAE